MNFRQKQGELPHAFFMCKTAWNMEKDEPKGTVELVGSISLNKLKAGSPNVHTIRKGDFLPGTKTRMQADNFGVEFKHLNSDWQEVIEYIVGNSPPDLSKYPNPYTGEVMPQYQQSKEPLADKNNTQTSPMKESIFRKILKFFGLC